ncbi:MAG: iron complex outermembrane receptor protein [Gammaproteobacteria bacterium]
MADRITQSADILLQESESQNLEGAGFSGASGLRSFRFYVNDFDTETEGIDVVANYPFKLSGGNSTLSMTYNYNTTKVTRFDAATLDELRIRQIEKIFPRHRGNVTWSHVLGSWRTMVRTNYFGNYWIAHVGDLGLVFDPAAEVTVDIEVALSFGKESNFAIIAGAENAFDNAPDKNPYSTVIGAKYSEYTPINGIGGVYYMRLRYES